MLSDEGCKYLFQLTRSDSSNLLSSSLRTTSTLFATMRVHLKPQLELFLSYLIDRLSPPPSALHPSHGVGGSSASSVAGGGGAASEKEEQQGGKGGSGSALGLTAHGETRDLLLEALAHLARYPSFLVDLWVNYDCDMDREDLFEKTVGFLTRVSSNAPFLSPTRPFLPFFQRLVELTTLRSVRLCGWCRAGSLPELTWSGRRKRDSDGRSGDLFIYLAFVDQHDGGTSGEWRLALA